MTQYILKAIGDDYYSTWELYGFTSDLSPDKIAERIAKLQEHIAALREKLDIANDALWNKYPDAVYDKDYPEDEFNFVTKLNEEYHEAGWLEFDNQTGFYVNYEWSTFNILSLEEWYNAICYKKKSHD